MWPGRDIAFSVATYTMTCSPSRTSERYVSVKALFAHHREPHVVFDIASFVSHTVCDVLNTDMLLGHTEVVILWSMPYMNVFVFQASINK